MIRITLLFLIALLSTTLLTFCNVFNDMLKMYIGQGQSGGQLNIGIADVLDVGDQFNWTLVYIGIIISIFSTLGALVFFRQLSTPSRSLLVAAQKLSKSSVSQQIKISSSNEVGQLAEAYHEMILDKIEDENESKQSYQKLRKIVAELEDQKFALDQHSIVVVTNVSGAIVFANDKFIQISGFSRVELIGENQRIIKSGHHDLAFFREMYRTISNGKVWRSEVCNRSKSGQLYWVDTTIVPFMDANNKPKNYIAIRTDITAHKQAEIDLLNALEVTETALNTKSEFLASMSHEIRTPMNSILGILGLLQHTQLDDEQSHLVTIAENSAQSLLTLINDILDFSKVEAGMLDFENIDFDLRAMLGDFADAMALQAQEKGLELILDMRGVELSIVKGDATRLRQILTNLVSNAIKFTSNGEVVICVHLSSANEQQLQMRCSIIDTGIGIPADKQATLFDFFTQGDASTTRQYGGTGLGLAIVKKLCALMGGTITVISELNIGSCFEVNVLLTKSGQAQQLIPQVDIQNLNILLVDDNVTSCEILSGQLEHWGASVESAVSGQDALLLCAQRAESAAKTYFDIAFLDLKMPEMDGVELAKKIKADDRFQSMKLIMMTQVNTHVDTHFFSELGISAYFSKPATSYDLFAALSTIAGDNYIQQMNVQQYQLETASQQVSKVEAHTKVQTVWPENSRVLLVDDNKINQLVAKEMLKIFGIHSDIAANGLQALQCLQQAPENAPYSLVLMDCQMPEMDGYEATRAIRAGKAGMRNQLIPIVATTANAMQGDREKCLQAGMNDYLAKPIEVGVLKETLRHWLVADAELIASPLAKPRSKELNMKTTELAIWEQSAALKRLLGDQSLLVVLVDLFLTDIPTRLSALQNAITDEDYEQVGWLAHALKGAAANLSALQLQQQSAFMEGAAKQADMNKVTAIWPDLLHASEQLMQYFVRYKDNYKSDNEPTSVLLSHAELSEYLQVLQLKLKHYEFIDQNELLTLNQVSSDAVVQALIKQLQEHISQFDHAAALSTLAEITAKTNIELSKEH
ncbi:MAG: response regulator [Methyloprofundus sp.]|nr:response regulator [Methyloprofundus sp.]